MHTSFLLKHQKRDELDTILLTLREALESGDHIVTIEPDNQKTRTKAQNKALHRYCDLQAQKHNDAGYTQRTLWEKLKRGFELPITMLFIKDIFRKVAKDMFGVKSTAELTTSQISEVYKSVDAGFARTTGIRTEWPSWR